MYESTLLSGQELLICNITHKWINNIIIITIFIPSVAKIPRVKAKLKRRAGVVIPRCWRSCYVAGWSLSAGRWLISVGKECGPLGYLLRQKWSIAPAQTKTQWLTRSEGRASLLPSVETCDLTELNCRIWLIFDRPPVQLLHHLSKPPRSYRSLPGYEPLWRPKSRAFHAAKVSASAPMVVCHLVLPTWWAPWLLLLLLVVVVVVVVVE